MLAFSAQVAAADPVDLNNLPADLAACKPAALRLCDRSQPHNAAALWSCAAVLAARHLEIGRVCISVLRRYGHL
jgi:hypothetical protein